MKDDDSFVCKFISLTICHVLIMVSSNYRYTLVASHRLKFFSTHPQIGTLIKLVYFETH